MNKREIKFRAWGIDTFPIEKHKVMAFFTLEDVIKDGDRCFITDYKNDDLITMDYDGSEIMQYTGLKDKNGKEIYEGDIVRSGNGRQWIVRLGEYLRNEPSGLVDGLGWYLHPIEDLIEQANSPIEFRPQAWFEIIGNIYENPSLLTEKK